MLPKNTVYLIDASIYIFRYYFSLPDNWWSDSGTSTAAVYGYSTWLLRLLRKRKPRFIAAAYDESLQNCFRNQIYPAYKANRALPDAELAFQLKACQQISQLMGIPSYVSAIHEADDILATLVKRSRQKHLPVCIVSRDKDLAQLVLNDREFFWDYDVGDCFNQFQLQMKLGIKTHQVPDYLALVGDSSDNIPGVPGVGAKTAVALLAMFEDWQQIKANLDKVAVLPLRGAKSLADKLLCYSEDIDIALQLTRLVDKAPLGRRFSLRRVKPDLEALYVFAQTLGFGEKFNKLLDEAFAEQ